MHVDFFHSLDAAKLSMLMIMLAESSKLIMIFYLNKALL